MAKKTQKFAPVDDIDYFDGADEEKICREVEADFNERRSARRPVELQWILNMNFLLGNQYCSITAQGDIEDEDKQYFWQQREVFNHIAPIVESRLAKLGRVRPKMSVAPASGEDKDLHAAKVSTGILESVYHKHSLDGLIKEATLWSETCGTVFYKIMWDLDGGRKIGATQDGKPVKEGDININVVPPFEIFPDSAASSDVDKCVSIIHAKAYPVQYIADTWGAQVQGADIDVLGLAKAEGSLGGLGYSAAVNSFCRSPLKDHAIVIERYERPCGKYPLGRLIIVAGGKLLHIGPLPYEVGEDGQRGFPFVRQCAIEQAGCFWGASVIERSIPVQRAYNAVKNRKHEFLNRAALGVLTVEDGTVDTDNLAEEGLSPGKLIVYRQGANPPQFMDTGRIPADFTYEEDRLLSEFINITGVSELMRNSAVPNSVSSGAALQLLIDQDDTRLTITADNIKQAIKEVSKRILRLYKQYGGIARVSRIVGEDGSVSILKWRASDITSDDIIITTQNELSDTPASKRSFIFDLLAAGILNDENGRMSAHMRYKVLNMLGMGDWENAKDLEELHIKRAQEENEQLTCDYVEPCEIDNHELHIAEHTRFMLGSDYKKACGQSKKAQKNFLRHLRHHRALAKAGDAIEKLISQGKELAGGLTGYEN